MFKSHECVSLGLHRFSIKSIFNRGYNLKSELISSEMYIFLYLSVFISSFCAS